MQLRMGNSRVYMVSLSMAPGRADAEGRLIPGSNIRLISWGSDGLRYDYAFPQRPYPRRISKYALRFEGKLLPRRALESIHFPATRVSVHEAASGLLHSNNLRYPRQLHAVRGEGLLAKSGGGLFLTSPIADFSGPKR